MDPSSDCYSDMDAKDSSGHGAGPGGHAAIQGGGVLPELGGGEQGHCFSSMVPDHHMLLPLSSSIQHYWPVLPRSMNPTLFGLWPFIEVQLMKSGSAQGFSIGRGGVSTSATFPPP